MAQKWYKKATVQVALIAGTFTIIAALIGLLGKHTTIIIPTPQSNVLSEQESRSKYYDSLDVTIKDISRPKTRIPQKKIQNMNISDGSVLVHEIKEKSLEQKLIDAKNYLKSGNIQNKENSTQLYREIISELSPQAKNELDQELLSEANIAYKNSHNDDAARKYAALFRQFYNP